MAESFRGVLEALIAAWRTGSFTVVVAVAMTGLFSLPRGTAAAAGLM